MNNEEIYKNYIKDVYKYTYYILKNKEQSEDLTSEVFLRFFENKSNVIHLNIKPYIIGIARNMIFDKYKEKSYKNYSLFNTDGEIIEFEDKQYNIENIEIDNNLIEIIKKNLNKLDKLTQEIIVLKIWEELKFNEIAEVVKENINTVKTLYYKGIEELKYLLNSNLSLKLKSNTLPILLTGLLLISHNNEFNISKTIISSLTKQVIFFNNIHMDTATGSAAFIAKTGFLATTAGKIAVGVSSLALVVTVTGAGAYIVNNTNKANSNTSSSSVSSPLYSSLSSSNSSFSSDAMSTGSSSSNIISSSSSSINSSTISSSSSSAIIPDIKQFRSAKYGVSFSYQTSMGDVVVGVEPYSGSESLTFTNSKLVLTYPKNNGARGGDGLSKDFPNPIKIISKDGKEFTLLIQDSQNSSNKYDLFGIWSKSNGQPSNFWITQPQSVSKDEINLNINQLKYLISTMTLNY